MRCTQICEKAGTRSTVNRSMIEGEDQRCHISELNGSIRHHSSLTDSTHTQNRTLRRVENRREPIHAEPHRGLLL